ncbi:MAG: 30S ribosomal protein S17 [Phycisphaerae bacterium]
MTAPDATATRGRRATRIGLVTSDKRDKTIAVTISWSTRHAKYGKLLKRSTVLHAHDEKNEAKLGDTVEVSECRPISKTKCWRLLRVLRTVGGAEARP